MAGNNLYFPYDNRNDYKGKISFRAYKTNPPSVALEGLEGIIASIPEFLSGSNESPATSGTAPTSVAANRDRQSGTAAPTSQETQSGAIISPKTQEIDLTRPAVILYLPQTINITDGANYEQVELGVGGALMAGQLNKGVGAVSAIESAVKNQITSIVDSLKTNPAIATDAARLASVRVVSKFSGEAGGNVAASVLRTTINPNRRQLFRGVNIREFSFNFKMIANSAREAREIDRIIKFFRTELYPKSIDLAGESIGYEFPNLFEIKMEYNGNQVATRLAPAYLRNVDVVYNPSSMGYHVDGKASEVDLRLTFTEERTLAKQDIEAGY